MLDSLTNKTGSPSNKYYRRHFFSPLEDMRDEPVAPAIGCKLSGSDRSLWPNSEMCTYKLYYLGVWDR